MRHANRKAARARTARPNEREILTFRGTVAGRSRAQHRRPRVAAARALAGYPREAPTTTPNWFRLRWKNTPTTSTNIRHTRLRGSHCGHLAGKSTNGD